MPKHAMQPLLARLGVLAVAASWVATSAGASPSRAAPAAEKAAAATAAVPRPAVQRWMDLQLGMFLHFGLNTFTGQQSSGEPRVVLSVRWHARTAPLSSLLHPLSFLLDLFPPLHFLL